MRRLVIVSLLGSFTVAAPAQAQEVCPAVEVITAAGSGDANPADDPNDPMGFTTGTNHARIMEERFEGVRSWQLPYSGSVGIIGSNDKVGLAEIPNYAESEADGVARLDAHVKEVRSACPDAAFVLTGFSQGAQVVGDVLAGLSPENASRVLSAYLLSDPRRGHNDGAQLIETNWGPIPPETAGFAGPRAEGTFARYGGAVRSICSHEDPVCDTPTDGLLAAAGQWVMQADGSAYHVTPVVAFDSMLKDGSFVAAVAPVAPVLVRALGAGDVAGVGDGLRQAAATPWLSEAQRNTVTLTAHEVEDLLGYLAGRGYAQVAPVAGTGSTDLDAVLALAQLASAPEVADSVPQALHMFDRHFNYRGETLNFTTIDGVRVDDWLVASMSEDIAAHLGRPEARVAAVPAGKRLGPGQFVGRALWEVANRVLGARHPLSRALWAYFEL